MNTGGRRRPLSPVVRGLSVCALMIAVLSLWLGAATGRSSSDGHALPSVAHSVAMAHVALRPPAPDLPDAVPAELVVLTLAAAGVLIGIRRRAQPVRVRSERRQGRAPPGGPAHR